MSNKEIVPCYYVGDNYFYCKECCIGHLKDDSDYEYIERRDEESDSD